MGHKHQLILFMAVDMDGVHLFNLSRPSAPFFLLFAYTFKENKLHVNPEFKEITFKAAVFQNLIKKSLQIFQNISSNIFNSC